MPQRPLTFLQPNPTREQLLRAVAENHRQWFTYGARTAGGEIRRENGAPWIYTPGTNGEVVIPFPRLKSATAGAQLDRILEECRRRPLRQVSCWSMTPPRPRDLGARLLARGFEWGWQPHWMWLDLHRMQSDHPQPPGLRVEPIDDSACWDVDDLPYYHRQGAARLDAMARAQPRPGTHAVRVWHFAALMDGQPVGHSVVFLTIGRLGVAGIYNCGVVPAARNQGIGKTVTAAACRQAERMGCHHALLNATGMGEPVYRRIGFESIGFGQTWWLHAPVLAAAPPSQIQIALAEAVGRGDRDGLDRIVGELGPETLDAPLACGLTPVQVAVKAGQPRSVEWLVRHGATLDVLSAWDLGWKDRVPGLLARSPELANLRSGGWQITPMHEAAARGDAELARVLLAAGPDLEIRDTEVYSTPLGWARHFQRTEIIALIEQHLAGS
jgi:GNAT superfamily N-acetyltransferase